MGRMVYKLHARGGLRRHFHYLQCIRPCIAALSTDGQVIGVRRGRSIVGHLTGRVRAAGRVLRVGDGLAIGVHDPAKPGSIQCTAIRGQPFQGDPVGRPRHEVDGEPVQIEWMFDIPGNESADCDAPGHVNRLLCLRFGQAQRVRTCFTTNRAAEWHNSRFY